MDVTLKEVVNSRIYFANGSKRIISIHRIEN